MSKTPSSSSTGKPTEPRKRRWLWPVLIVSLSLNLLFIGLVAGRMLTQDDRGGRQRIFTGAIEKLMQDLPEAKRLHAGELLKKHRETVKTARRDLREARRNAREAVLTEPFDEAKVSAALARFREIRSVSHQSMHDMMLGLMKELNLEERKKLLSYIREGFRKRRGRWRRGESSTAEEKSESR